MMWWGDGWNAAAWGGFALMHVLWWALVIVGIISVIRWAMERSARDRGRFGEDRALEILRERFARGEISKEEFDERRRVLKA